MHVWVNAAGPDFFFSAWLPRWLPSLHAALHLFSSALSASHTVQKVSSSKSSSMACIRSVYCSHKHIQYVFIHLHFSFALFTCPPGHIRTRHKAWTWKD